MHSFLSRSRNIMKQMSRCLSRSKTTYLYMILKSMKDDVIKCCKMTSLHSNETSAVYYLHSRLFCILVVASKLLCGDRTFLIYCNAHCMKFSKVESIVLSYLRNLWFDKYFLPFLKPSQYFLISSKLITFTELPTRCIT